MDNFDGDLQLAMDYIFRNFVGEELDSYSENLSERDRIAYFDLIMTSMDQCMTKEEIRSAVKRANILAYLDMEEEDVLKAEKNPFVKKTLIRPVRLLADVAVTGVAIVIGRDNNTIWSTIALLVAILGSSAFALFFFRLVIDFIKCFRFKKIKRILEKEKEEKENR